MLNKLGITFFVIGFVGFFSDMVIEGMLLNKGPGVVAAIMVGSLVVGMACGGLSLLIDEWRS